MPRLKDIFLGTRPSFLLLTLVVVLLGTASAWSEGFFNPFYFLLNLAGVTLAHIGVNTFNEYFDYRSGVDIEIYEKGWRTPFSGGSGLIPSGALSPQTSLLLAIASLIVATPIGIFFVYIRGIAILPILIIAFLTIVLYTPFFSKLYLGEFLAGLNFGPLAVIGTYFVQTGSYEANSLFPSLIPGILTFELLLINELPDYVADANAGRRNLVTKLGTNNASRLYSTILVSTYGLIVIGVFFYFIPITGLISLATIPLAFKASKIALENHSNNALLVPALANNVSTVIITTALLALSYIFAGFI